MRKVIRCMLTAIFAITLIMAMSGLASAKTYTNFQSVHISETQPAKCGDYYFAYNGMDGCNYVGTSESKINKKTSLPDDFWCDGNYAFYIDVKAKKLYSYNLAERKRTSLKSLTSYTADNMEIVGGYKKLIYLTYTDYDAMTYKSYCYNRTAKTWKCVSSGSEILAMKDGYVVTHTGYSGSPEPISLTLRKIGSTGSLSKVKTLTSTGMQPQFIGSYLYYVYYPNKYKDGGAKMNKAIIKRCKTDGSGLVSLGTFTNTDDHIIMVYNITSKYCYVKKLAGDESYPWKIYKYTYATKELKYVKKSQY